MEPEMNQNIYYIYDTEKKIYLKRCSKTVAYRKASSKENSAFFKSYKMALYEWKKITALDPLLLGKVYIREEAGHQKHLNWLNRRANGSGERNETNVNGLHSRV